MATITIPSGVTTYVLDAYSYSGRKVELNGEPVYDVSYCGPGAFYFLSKAGGWSAFLIEGKIKRTDKYTQTEYRKSFDNQTIEFGRVRLLNEVQPTWEVTTGFMTDQESERLAENLLPSQRVYLHLFDTDEILPVVITDSQCEHKTYDNQKDTPFYYTIKVEASQPLTRR